METLYYALHRMVTEESKAHAEVCFTTYPINHASKNLIQNCLHFRIFWSHKVSYSIYYDQLGYEWEQVDYQFKRCLRFAILGAQFFLFRVLQITLHMNGSNWILSSKDVKVSHFDLAISFFFHIHLLFAHLCVTVVLTHRNFDTVIVQ